MTTRVQRRFLAMPHHPALDGLVPVVIMQGYLMNSDGYVVRVRRMSVPRVGGDEYGTVSIKGPRSGDGSQAQEEYLIEDVALLAQILRRCDRKILKRRYALEGQVSLDVFDWDNEGLVIAEVRGLPADLDVGLPGWVGREVTGETVFNNEWLAARPWKTWSVAEQGVWLQR